MSNPMSISVIIPLYNSEDFIEKALISVCTQTYPYFEVIISDDASTDSSVDKVKEILGRYPDVSYQLIEGKENKGAGASRNKALKCVKNDWIAFLDSDDHWPINKLEKVIEVINDNDTNFVFHNELTFESDALSNEFNFKNIDYISRYNSDIHPFLALVRVNFLSPTSATIHKSLFDKVGYFDESLRSAQDYDLWLRMSLVGLKLSIVPDFFACYWVRDGNITSNSRERLTCLLRIIEKNEESIKQFSPHPKKELRHWKGVTYSTCGLMFFHKKQYFFGLFYMIYGQFFKIRTDWIKRLIKKVVNFS